MTATSAFDVTSQMGMMNDLGMAPRKVKHAFSSWVFSTLQERPDRADAPRVKKLDGYKDLWRVRVSDDYRLVYRIDRAKRVVTMLLLDHRNKVYERLGADARDGTPGIRIVARAPELLEREPTPEQIGEAVLALAPTESSQTMSAPDRPLPDVLKPEMLTDWGIPARFHQQLCTARTEGELLGLVASVPDEILQRVTYALYPPLIEEILQQPIRVVPEASALVAVAEGTQSLESLLLKLDADQKSFVTRFDGRGPKGPWLLKGGPGSGKSTVALYCIQALVRRIEGQLPLDNSPRRILFTTFTKSLVNASAHLSKNLIGDSGRHVIDIRTVDSLAWQHLPAEWRGLQLAPHNGHESVVTALAECAKTGPKFNFRAEDVEFLKQEIEWVIVGQGLTSVDDYLRADRAGRGRALGQQQRQQVWQLFEVAQRLMREAGVCLLGERVQQATRRAAPAYDYVFIDEAQDLKPVAIRLCIALCRDRTNVFLTADTNQSIYGNALPWSKVASELRFQGRAETLRRNYRTTTQIWEAIKQLAPNTIDADRETIEVETVYEGPYPRLARYTSWSAVGVRLNAFLYEAIREERVTPSSAAVLCATYDDMQRVVKMIDPRFNARAMSSQEMDLGHPGVKVTTMHAAKGLQFPIVAVLGVEAGTLPRRVPPGLDPTEENAKYQRLLFVACTRAMRQLIVFANRERPSMFIDGVRDDRWEFEDLG